jgi:hypothetical protein
MDDIYISECSNINSLSYSDLGECYKHPQFAPGTIESQTFLAGSVYFQIIEIEAFCKE